MLIYLVIEIFYMLNLDKVVGQQVFCKRAVGITIFKTIDFFGRELFLQIFDLEVKFINKNRVLIIRFIVSFIYKNIFVLGLFVIYLLIRNLEIICKFWGIVNIVFFRVLKCLRFVKYKIIILIADKRICTCFN